MSIIESNPDYVGPVESLQPNEDRLAVYRFEAWDPAQGKNVIAPYMAAPGTIRRMKGMADLGSKRIVARNDLDSRGFYAPDTEPASHR